MDQDTLNNAENNYENKGISIYILYVIIVFILSSRLLNYGLVILSLEVVYFTIVAMYGVRISKKHKKLLVYLLVFLTIQTLYVLLGISEVNLSVQSHYYRWGFILFVQLIINKKYSERVVEKLCKLIIIVVESHIIYAIFSVHILGNTDYRISASYSTAVMILSGICLVWFLNSQKLQTRIIIALLLSSQIYYNFLIAERATNILLSIIMYFLIIVFNFPTKKYTKLLAVTLGIFLYFSYISGNLEILLKWLSNLIESEGLAYRFDSIIEYLQHGRDLDSVRQGSFKIRLDLNRMSLDTFFSSARNFLFGIGDHRTMFGISNPIKGIGNHSELIDSLARFGIIGTLVFVKILIEQYKLLIDETGIKNNSKLFAQFNIIFLIYIIRNIWGGAVFDHNAVQFLVLFIFQRMARSN